jgi:hypothetical protein
VEDFNQGPRKLARLGTSSLTRSQWVCAWRILSFAIRNDVCPRQTVKHFKTWNVVADDKLLRDVNKVRTNVDKIRILVAKVYHFFRSSKSEQGGADNRIFGVN